MIRMALQKAVVGLQRLVMQAQLHQAGAQGQMRFDARGVVGDGLAEGCRGLLPSFDAAQAHAGIEVRGGMQRLQQRRLRIALRGRKVILQFVLQLAEREIQAPGGARRHPARAPAPWRLRRACRPDAAMRLSTARG